MSGDGWGGAIRRLVIEESRRAGVGHVGSCLSVADVLGAVYADVLRAEGPDDPDRDRFVMAKGHAALALYAALHLRGWIARDALATFCSDGSPFGVHPDRSVPGVDFSTGSLGHGLGLAAGAALAARLAQSRRRAYALMSDAEGNCGSVWEAAMFAAHHRLDNLVGIVDWNGQQALGSTDDVLSMAPLADKWRTFGWAVEEVDGHDHDALVRVMAAPEPGRPRLVLARTVFGKGVSFMERNLRWHYQPLSGDDYVAALAELGVG